MDGASEQKLSQNNKKSIQLVFFAPFRPQIQPQYDLDSYYLANGGQNNLSFQQMKTKIDFHLIDFEHHYKKDIISYFPQIQSIELLVSPKMIDDSWRVEKADNWKIQSLNYPQSVKNWFPVFYDRNNPRQYFQQQLQLIVVILQTDYQYQGFIGYVPESLNMFIMVRELYLFYGLSATTKTNYITNIEGWSGNILDLKYKKVSQFAGNYVKLYSFLDKKQAQKGQAHKYSPKQKDILDDMLDQQRQMIENNSIMNYNAQNQDTNHAATQLLWGSQIENDIQTRSEPYGQSRKNLIALKSFQQVQKIKNRAKLAIQNPKIDIPKQLQEEMQRRLAVLSQQIEKRMTY